MSEQKHTPGPWHWQPCGREGCSEFDTDILVSADDTWVIHPCVSGEQDRESFLQMSNADALLISAAPDLLASLKELREMVVMATDYIHDIDPGGFEKFKRKCNGAGIADGICARADSAIAKAGAK